MSSRIPLLRRKEDRRTVGFIATYFALTIVAWNVAMPLWAEIPMVIALCSFAWFGAVITHNTIHVPVFKRRWMNKAFQVALTNTYGHPVSTFVPGHNLSHHRFTEQPRDVMRTTKVRFRWNLLNFVFFFPMVAPGILRGEQKYIKAMKSQRPRWYRQLMLESIVLYGGMVALAILDWQKFLLYWYLPHFWAGLGIVTINFFQHDGCDAESEHNHSRNFVDPFFNWWTFNNGFHSIHHDHPTLHWADTPAAHAAEVAPHIHPNLEQRSLPLWFWRTFIWPGKRLRYDGTPLVLPPPAADEPWAPARGEVIEGMSLGAES